MDIMSDKLSIKNLLFTKAIPNYVIPTPLNGHKVYACTDCGDKFLFESSYNDHINRRSAKISYNCRHCTPKVFFNRCNLLCHIRSHAFKTATINVTDLKIELLPLNSFKAKVNLPTDLPTSSTKETTVFETTRKPYFATVTCFECNKNVTTTGIAYKDRASHFMQYTNQVYSCPVCLFALPSICALKVHLRIHLKCPPFYCPECGIHLANKNVQYPYNHDCEGFKMMRATARLNCSVPECCLFHPNDYKEHMRRYHLKKVYKCPCCVVACFNQTTMDKHLKCNHKTTAAPVIFYQCALCPGRYVLENPKLNDTHLKSHINTTIFPCWACGSFFKEVSSLLTHFIMKHNKVEVVETALNSILADSALVLAKPKRIYRVVKRCDQCKRSFTYKCKYEEIQILPNECPYKCTSTMESNVTPESARHSNEGQITCHLCRIKLSQDWSEIKKHYADLHKEHKCLDAEILLTRGEVTKYLSQKKSANTKPNLSKIIKKVGKKSGSKKINISSSPATTSSLESNHLSVPIEVDGSYSCNICGNSYDEKSTLEKHMVTHRDPCMAYQCMECGRSYVVKPSFSKHLLLEHGITDTEEYIINNKQCYNQNALMKYQNVVEIVEEPLEENQCNICREKFDGLEDLEKHFRTHGMAFLMKNTSNKNVANL